MRNLLSQFLSRCVAMLGSIMLTFVLGSGTQAQTFQVLHDFGVAAGDGNFPSSPLLKDSAGNLYGTTGFGGAHNWGTVFRLSPTSTGGFTETILYSFKGGSADGAYPQGTLVRDSVGNLYGVTQNGGITGTGCGVTTPNPGCGVVFRLHPTTTGGWAETVLHRFTGTDGGTSFAGLVQDSKGNFYGATSVGGSAGRGTVFKLSHTSTGWKEIVLHSFTGGADGAEPMMFQTALTLDGLGNIYGSAYSGGSSTVNAGVIFELIPQTSGAWTEKILHTFQSGADGSEPLTGVILDKSGNVYGTTLKGGTQLGSGVVFKLTAANGYTKTVLHNFNALTDPARSNAHGVFFDANGNLFGTTEYALYELTPAPTDWTETLLWSFDGEVPVYAPAIMDAQGHIWGTTLVGGLANGGIAWEFIP
jgi:uncharacterized repeat protein (TIGR03803 family)